MYIIIMLTFQRTAVNHERAKSVQIANKLFPLSKFEAYDQTIARWPPRNPLNIFRSERERSTCWIRNGVRFFSVYVRFSGVFRILSWLGCGWDMYLFGSRKFEVSSVPLTPTTFSMILEGSNCIC